MFDLITFDVCWLAGWLVCVCVYVADVLLFSV